MQQRTIPGRLLSLLWAADFIETWHEVTRPTPYLGTTLGRKAWDKMEVPTGEAASKPPSTALSPDPE